MTQNQGLAVGVVGTLAVTLGLIGFARAETPEKPTVEPKADQLLKQMSDFLAKQQAFSVGTEHGTEVVLKTGQKLDLVANSNVVIQRPNRLRTDRSGEIADLSFYYDGKEITLYGRKMNMYATAEAPHALDAAIDFARQQLDLEAPAADLLYSNPYKVLMEDVVSGSYIGEAVIDGKQCHHLAFRGNETDWQIWIEDGARPLPLRFVIVSKKVTGAPEFTVTLKNWNLNPTINPDLFTFTPPPKAERIEFVRLGQIKQTRR
jgi:hypothetical protein